jgi:TetR/AcrR family transcriptional regulator, transcriptional repressor for nem operon
MALSQTRREANTPERILDVAERLVQIRGFNGFSYADIAGELGVTRASLHYHFPGKAELGEALITRYATRFADALQRIDDELPDARTKLDAYVALYTDVLKGRRMCLCGILAAEYQTLPPPMRDAVLEFFDDNVDWLARVLQEDATVSFDGSPQDAAQTLLGGLEGAMLVARSYGDVARFSSAASRLLASVGV